MKKRDKNIRAIHRDFGYFYLGLIITFAFSGILMNHRDSFHAEKYTIETKAVEVKIAQDKEISEDDERRSQDEVQKMTDRFVAEIDKIISEKEKEIMTV